MEEGIIYGQRHSNGQSLFSMLSPIAATNGGVCCKYAAIISIINLGFDLVRESYPKSICFELYPLRILLSFLVFLKMVSNDTHDFAI
jgi:hypothetical protein